MHRDFATKQRKKTTSCATNGGITCTILPSLLDNNSVLCYAIRQVSLWQERNASCPRGCSPSAGVSCVTGGGEPYVAAAGGTSTPTHQRSQQGPHSRDRKRCREDRKSYRGDRKGYRVKERGTPETEKGTASEERALTLMRQPTHTTASTVCDRARNLPIAKRVTSASQRQQQYQTRN